MAVEVVGPWMTFSVSSLVCGVLLRVYDDYPVRLSSGNRWKSTRVYISDFGVLIDYQFDLIKFGGR